MTSKERVLCALRHQRPDRIPRFDSYWTEFETLCRSEVGIPPEVSLGDYFEIDIVIDVPDESPWPSRAQVLEKLPDGSTIRQNGYGAKVRSKDNGYFEEELDVLIHTPEDLILYPIDDVAQDARYPWFSNYYHQEASKGRCVFGKIGGPFIRSTFIRGKTDYLLDVAGDEEFARDVAERVGDLLLGIALEEMRRVDLSDTGIWIFDDMAYNHGPLLSPRSFERIFFPIYKRLIAALKAAGCPKVYFHSDGNIRLLLDMLLDAGISGINPVEPRAGMSMTKLKKVYGNQLALIGGMCNSQTLVHGTKREIESQAAEIIELAQDGGVIIGAHSIGPDIPVSNYLTYINYLNKHGQF